MRERLPELVGQRADVRYVGRPERASPAEGWSEAHAAEQRRIISEILEEVPSHAR
jgi:2-oxoglutarate dehydrogenase E1 component